MRDILIYLWRARLAVALYLLLLGAGLLLGHAIYTYVVPEIQPKGDAMMRNLVILALLLYMLTTAIPFVPGAEIGLALMMIFGAQAAPVVYVALVIALMISYAVARLVPPGALARLCRAMRLLKAAALMEAIDAMPPPERARLIADRMPEGLGQVALKNRFLLLGLLLNVPGNTALGGGGGLAFAAGITGLYRPLPFLLTVLIGVSPGPLAFALFGA